MPLGNVLGTVRLARIFNHRKTLFIGQVQIASISPLSVEMPRKHSRDRPARSLRLISLPAHVPDALLFQKPLQHFDGHVVGTLVDIHEFRYRTCLRNRLRGAMKVLGTVTMTSPASIPHARIAKRKASVPLLTPRACFVPQNAANAASNSSTISGRRQIRR